MNSIEASNIRKYRHHANEKIYLLESLGKYSESFFFLLNIQVEAKLISLREILKLQNHNFSYLNEDSGNMVVKYLDQFAISYILFLRKIIPNDEDILRILNESSKLNIIYNLNSPKGSTISALLGNYYYLDNYFDPYHMYTSVFPEKNLHIDNFILKATCTYENDSNALIPKNVLTIDNLKLFTFPESEETKIELKIPYKDIANYINPFLVLEKCMYKAKSLSII